MTDMQVMIIIISVGVSVIVIIVALQVHPQSVQAVDLVEHIDSSNVCVGPEAKALWKLGCSFWILSL